MDLCDVMTKREKIDTAQGSPVVVTELHKSSPDLGSGTTAAVVFRQRARLIGHLPKS